MHACGRCSRAAFCLVKRLSFFDYKQKNTDKFDRGLKKQSMSSMQKSYFREDIRDFSKSCRDPFRTALGGYVACFKIFKRGSLEMRPCRRKFNGVWRVF